MSGEVSRVDNGIGHLSESLLFFRAIARFILNRLMKREEVQDKRPS